MLVGGDPIRAYAFMAKAAFGDIGVFSDTLVKATPLILVSLAAVVAFRMRLWNIGAEGQFYLGAFGASLVVLTPILPPETSPWLMIPSMMVMGMLAGALWGFIPDRFFDPCAYYRASLGARFKHSVCKRDC